MRPSSRRKRDAALKAAERQFLATGYESVTMDSIAAESGIAKQTLYTYFGSKRELFLELVSARTTAATASVVTDAPEIGPTTDPRAALEGVLRFQLKTVLSPALLRLRRLVIGEFPRSPELAEALYQHGPRKAIEKLAAMLRQFDAAGSLEVADPDSAAVHLNWLVMGDPINRAMHLGEEAAAMSDSEIERHVSAALDAFFHGAASLRPTNGTSSG